MPKITVSSINKFVQSFLSSDDCSVESWQSTENQKQLKALLSGKQKKEKSKRQKSAYMLFSDENRAQVRAEFPELKATEVMSLLSKRWNELKSDPAKQSEVARYQALASANRESNKESKTQEKKEKPKKQVRAKSQYLIFCEENRPMVIQKNPELKSKEIIKELARLWQLHKASQSK